MLKRLLPPLADNRFSGPGSALWLLALLLIVKGLMGANTILMGRYVAMTADGIPLESFEAEAAATVLSLFAIWGFGQLVLVLHGAIVLARYRSLVPLIYLILLFEHVGRRLLLLAMPISRTGTGEVSTGLMINLGLLALLLIGLLLSLRRGSGDGAAR